MLFIRRLLTSVLLLSFFILGILLGVKNSDTVTFSLLLFDMPGIPLGLLVMGVFVLGLLLGYHYKNVGGLLHKLKR